MNELEINNGIRSDINIKLRKCPLPNIGDCSKEECTFWNSKKQKCMVKSQNNPKMPKGDHS